MKRHPPPPPGFEEPAALSLPALVGQVYEAAPPGLRARMLEHLMRPLGMLSLVAIANGVFASIRLRHDWGEVRVRVEDAAAVRAADVVALAERLQQVSTEVLENLARQVAASPVMAGSAAAALLLSLVMQRARAARDPLDP